MDTIIALWGVGMAAIGLLHHYLAVGRERQASEFLDESMRHSRAVQQFCRGMNEAMALESYGARDEARQCIQDAIRKFEDEMA